jgi:hypothetical protein
LNFRTKKQWIRCCKELLTDEEINEYNVSFMTYENIKSIIIELKEATKDSDTRDTLCYHCTSVEHIKHVGSAVHCRFEIF